MNKHFTYGLWHRLRTPSLIFLVTVTILSGAVAIFSLRANNLRMIELRDAVYVADEQNGDVESALRDLRQFVYGHMNTNLRQGTTSSEPPIQLVGRYNRAVAAEQARAAALGGSNQVYVAAQRECENPNVPLTVRAQCVQDYVTRNGTGVAEVKLPPKDIYTFDFASPRWSADLAGWSIVATAFFAILLLVRVVYGKYMKTYLS